MNWNWLYGAAVAVALAVGTPSVRAQEVDSVSPRPRPANLTLPELEVVRFDEADLDELVAPVALYPDALLTQVFVAATYPLDVVKAERFITESTEMSDKERTAAAAREPWDPSVQILAGGFPAVIRTMAEDLDWTEQLGDAVIAQTDGMLDAVQRMRAQAAAAGNLATNEAQVVEVKDGAISVAPADAEVVYVPTYDPATAYAPAPVVVEDTGGSDLLVLGAVTFGTALLVNEIFDDDDDWHGYWEPGPAYIDWDDGDFYPRRDVDIDGDVNIDIDRTRLDGEGERIGDVDREALRARREDRRDAGAWEPSEEQRGKARSSIQRRQSDRGATGLGAAAATGVAGGVLAARSQGGGEARTRLEAANARRPPQRQFEGVSGMLKPQKGTPARISTARERGGSSLERGTSSRARPELSARPKSVSKPSRARQPTRKAQPSNSAFKKQGGGSRAKASSNRGSRSAGGRGGRGGGGRRR